MFFKNWTHKQKLSLLLLIAGLTMIVLAVFFSVRFFLNS